MVKKLKAVVFAFAFSLLGVSAPVFAQTDTSSSDEAVQTTSETEAAPSDKSAGREARVKAYKERAAAKLTEAQARRLTTRCKSAQGKVTTLRARVNNIIANRKKVYQEVGDKLDTLLERLTAAEMDTTALETARVDIRTELTALTESMNAYDTVLADLEEMDCEADPDTFQTALTEAREMRTTLRTQAQEFRRFATTELRTILQDIRTQLAEKEASTQDTTEETEGGN